MALSASHPYRKEVASGAPIIIGFLAIAVFAGRVKKIAITIAVRIVKFFFFISNPPLSGCRGRFDFELDNSIFTVFGSMIV
jgi:hypothetical protein